MKNVQMDRARSKENVPQIPAVPSSPLLPSSIGNANIKIFVMVKKAKQPTDRFALQSDGARWRNNSSASFFDRWIFVGEHV